MTIAKPTILAVDDTPDNLTVISSILKELYTVKVATDGETALKIATQGESPDLILLDIMMPDMDGYEVCRRLKANPKTRDIPAIFLTALNDPYHEATGLQLGAVDYVSKPISPPILLARIKNHLAFKAAADFLRDQAEFLSREVERRTTEIAAMQDATVMALSVLAETRDDRTGNHLRRTQHYVKALAEKLKTHPRFGYFLTEDTITRLFRSAPLHDIGNAALPSGILAKEGKFTSDEYKTIREHTDLGKSAIEYAEKALGTKTEFLQHAKDIAHSHQEKWDGSGYPEGKAGEDIPISARLMAVADVYDALVTPKSYKAALPHDQAVTTMRDGRGKHFDPDVLDAFIEIQSQFKDIAERFADRTTRQASPVP
jgi:putative two-component system response regulator